MIAAIKAKVMEKSRSKKLDHFYSLCSQDSSVLDVGVSSNEYSDSVNIFHRRFRFPASQYTGLGTQPMDGLTNKYPDKKFVQYEGGRFPFSDNEFDWVFSNAVIEHVGTRDQQIEFASEMMRVAKNIYFTTPNKFFPVDAHTNVIFRHWFDDHFYKWCSENNPHWTRENILLLSKSNVRHVLEKANISNYHLQTNRLLGIPMTYTIVCNG